MMMLATSEPATATLQFQNTNTKKRKDVDDFYHHFPSFPIPIPSSSKSRRLDPDLYAIMEEKEEEDPNHNLTTVHQHQDPYLPSTEERALVLYQPTDILKSPTSSDFSIVVKSDFIPGLKDYLLSWGITKPDNSVEDEMREKSSEVSNDCLAVVPWIAFHSLKASEEIVPETGQPLEAKQDEMMELDEPYADDNNAKAMDIGEMVETAGASSLWQQHCMMFDHLQSTSTPIHWTTLVALVLMVARASSLRNWNKLLSRAGVIWHARLDKLILSMSTTKDVKNYTNVLNQLILSNLIQHIKWALMECEQMLLSVLDKVSRESPLAKEFYYQCTYPAIEWRQEGCLR